MLMKTYLASQGTRPAPFSWGSWWSTTSLEQKQGDTHWQRINITGCQKLGDWVTTEIMCLLLVLVPLKAA